MRPHLLNAEECARELDQIPTWQCDGRSISQTFTAKTFPQVITWVVAIADVAEAMDHHPDLDIRWTSVTVRLTTHDRSGLTHLDFDQAQAIEKICR